MITVASWLSPISRETELTPRVTLHQIMASPSGPDSGRLCSSTSRVCFSISSAVMRSGMLAQLEGPPTEGARRVVDGIAVLHPAVEDGDRRLALGNEGPVEIDHALLH